MVEGSVRAGGSARSDVGIAGRQDASQRSGRRPILLRVLAEVHLDLKRKVDLERDVEIRDL